MTLCPYDLELCDRPACRGGSCEKSGERLLSLCNGCGSIVVWRNWAMCLDCNEQQIENVQEH